MITEAITFTIFEAGLIGALGLTTGFTIAMNLLRKYNQKIISNNSEILGRVVDVILDDSSPPKGSDDENG